MRSILAVLMLANLAACAVEPGVRVEVQQVRVPVPVRAVPPVELVHCADSLPAPTFEPAPGGALLPTAEIPRLQGLIASLRGCVDAWAVWGTTEEQPQ